MSLKQTVYFMTLAGGLAGLLTWLLQAFISDRVEFETQWIQVAIDTVLMGALIGGFTIGFADKWTAERLVLRWILVGIGLGMLAGLISGLLYIPVQAALIRGSEGGSALLGRSIIWLVAGGLIGFVTGMRWFSVNPNRAIHAMLGGLIGGGLGGLIFSLIAAVDEFFSALSFILTGMGITLGVTLAPVLLRNGVLQFINSGDPRAQSKRRGYEWIIQEGDRQVLGSREEDATKTIYRRDVHIHIPDALISPKHAVFHARNKRFFVELHPDNVGSHGQPSLPLQVRNSNVAQRRELKDGDDVIVGRTLLRFYTRKKAARA